MSDLATRTTCRLCQHVFTSSGSLLIDPGGQSKQKAQVAFMQTLVQHIQEKHPEALKEMAMGQMQYGGLLLLANFETTDQELSQHRNWLRWAIHQYTLNARITDEAIDSMVTKLGAQLFEPRANGPTARDYLIGIRDALQEPNEPPNPMAPKTN